MRQGTSFPKALKYKLIFTYCWLCLKFAEFRTKTYWSVHLPTFAKWKAWSLQRDITSNVTTCYHYYYCDLHNSGKLLTFLLFNNRIQAATQGHHILLRCLGIVLLSVSLWSSSISIFFRESSVSLWPSNSFVDDSSDSDFDTGLLAIISSPVTIWRSFLNPLSRFCEASIVLSRMHLRSSIAWTSLREWLTILKTRIQRVMKQLQPPALEYNMEGPSRGHASLN